MWPQMQDFYLSFICLINTYIFSSHNLGNKGLALGSWKIPLSDMLHQAWPIVMEYLSCACHCNMRFTCIILLNSLHEVRIIISTLQMGKLRIRETK